MNLEVKYQLMVKGRALIGREILPVSIKIDDNGLISSVKFGTLEGNDQVYDYNLPGKLIIPGLIDMHVHLRDWKLSYKETIETGSKAAAAGGFTIVADMPNTIPPVNTAYKVKERDKLLSNESFVDYMFYMGVPKSIRDLKESINLIAGVKVYPEDWKHLKIIQEILKHNILTIFHPELHECINNVGVYGKERPRSCEVKAVEKIVEMLSVCKGRVHITHVSVKEAARLILNFKRKHEKLTFDITPHHLLLNDTIYSKLDSIAKVNPPLRDVKDNMYLQKLLVEGCVDVVASDHAPHTLEEKLKPYPEASPGFPGLETTLPIMLNLSLRGIIPFTRIVEVLCRRPAEILGIHDLIGELKPGFLGSLTVIDLNLVKKVDPSTFISKAKYSPFNGWELKGWPIATFVRGKPVYVEGVIMGEKGWGCNLKLFKVRC